MKLKNLFLLTVAIIFFSCSSSKINTIQNGSKSALIQTAIMDFASTSRLFQKDTVFNVGIENFEFDKKLVSITGNFSRILKNDSIKVGSYDKAPSKFLIVEGKLFYWWDKNYPLTEEALAIYKKYGILQIDQSAEIADFTTDDTAKVVDYYFCKNDFRIFKKIITNKAAGYYDPPKLNCN